MPNYTGRFQDRVFSECVLKQVYEKEVMAAEM